MTEERVKWCVVSTGCKKKAKRELKGGDSMVPYVIS